MLAAGKSTRIRSVAGRLPKPVLPIAGRPIIEWNLRWLAESGVREVWVNLHHEPNAIQAALGDGREWGLRVRYHYEPEILGTAGAWRSLADHWGTRTLVVYGDNLVRFDLAAFVAAHDGSRALATIALFDPLKHVNTGIAGGKAALDEEGCIVTFVEGAHLPDGTRGLVNAGVYVLERRLLEGFPSGFADFGRDVLPEVARSGRLRGHVIESGGYCLGMDTPESWEVAEELVRAQRVVLR